LRGLCIGAMAVSQVFWLLSVKKSWHRHRIIPSERRPVLRDANLVDDGGRWDWGQALGVSLVAVGVVLAQRDDRLVVMAPSV
jgi:hypothetical protein